jgi:hypothetical protein
MNDNWLLAEKRRTQTALDDIAEHDLVKYVSDTHTRVRALEARLGFKLQYGTPKLLQPGIENSMASRSIS